MTALAIQPVSFSFHETHDVRIQVIDGEPWFCLKDVCDILTVDRTSRLLRDLDKKGLADCHTLTEGGRQKLVYVNEPNLYRVIFRSNKPEAKQFQDWVFNDVLPT
ncbi:Bro-N domain-containing protein, partial [Salmonella enterica]